MTDNVQPDGLDSPPKKRGRGRPPKCECLTDEYPYKKLVYYADPLDRRVLPAGVGLFWDGKCRGVVIMGFKQLKDGKLRWSKRVGRNKHTGGPTFHYDMNILDSSMLRQFGDACHAVLAEWFGGQQKADDRMIAREKEVKELIKPNALDDKWRKAFGK